MEPVKGKIVLLGVLFLSVLVTALTVVYTKHMNRKYFSELQVLQHSRDEMNIEWGQFLLERSTIATTSEIEKTARNSLNMGWPSAKEILSIKP